jgi:hypothetical protein
MLAFLLKNKDLFLRVSILQIINRMIFFRKNLER